MANFHFFFTYFLKFMVSEV